MKTDLERYLRTNKIGQLANIILHIEYLNIAKCLRVLNPIINETNLVSLISETREVIKSLTDEELDRLIMILGEKEKPRDFYKIATLPENEQVRTIVLAVERRLGFERVWCDNEQCNHASHPRSTFVTPLNIIDLFDNFFNIRYDIENIHQALCFQHVVFEC